MDSNNKGILEMDEMEQPKLSSTLNVLTILTFIGSALQIISGLFQFSMAKSNLDKSDEMLSKMNAEDAPSFVKNMVPDPATYKQLVTQNYDNRIPILIIAVVAAILCIMGAMQMRKLKKQGFTYYLIGQIIPFIGMAAFVGFFSFAGIGFYIAAGLTLLFILLYASQRKNLVY